MSQVILERLLAELGWVFITDETHSFLGGASKLKQAAHELIAYLWLGHHFWSHLSHQFDSFWLVRHGSHRCSQASIDTSNWCQKDEQVYTLAEKFSIFGQSREHLRCTLTVADVAQVVSPRVP